MLELFHNQFPQSFHQHFNQCIFLFFIYILCTFILILCPFCFCFLNKLYFFHSVPSIYFIQIIIYVFNCISEIQLFLFILLLVNPYNHMIHYKTRNIVPYLKEQYSMASHIFFWYLNLYQGSSMEITIFFELKCSNSFSFLRMNY